ncbi:MAG: hypothetical protein JJU29_08095 [Verrucomicrobia bacterium]|nr:hypothetical protein [Verrucomicrobiota bacterium]MCH8511874.1 pentapeptide repeat-containing protein [Kiritimatiellia bacterium]
MHINEFKSIVSAFADPGSEILHDKSKIIFSVNGELLDVAISTKDGDVILDDGNGPVSAGSWILKRLAKLPLLATRLREGVSDTNLFVSPSATILESLEVHPEEIPDKTNDALNSMLRTLGDKSPFETSIYYITSDAGEGKTFLINKMAKEQASRFIEGKADWLLVPIPLGGKHFLRFDDITVGALQNRYRFPFLYYDSFLALVRMGVIVPAFDGFEEMLVEGSSGEALSAMGILVSALDSRGCLVIAARKAYFEFENLKTQEKLFDTISTHSVGFGKLELHRWQKPQFLEYCEKRKVSNGEEIYQRVTERLGESHSLLTRPVLVRRLVDIATKCPSLDDFLDQIHKSGPDFFAVFVRGIIEREANEKWIDRSGERDLGTPLLSADEHCELLSLLALASWETRVDFLKRDNLEFVTDYYCETKKKSAFQAQQIHERIRGHALLINSPNASNAVEFDHEEFRLFFLGEGIAEQILPLDDKAKGEVLATLRRGVLPKPAQRSFIRAIKRHPTFERVQAAEFLLHISTLDGQASYTQENCGSLVVRLLSEVDAKGLQIKNIVFPPDSLRDRKLNNITFKNCFFSPTSLEMSTFTQCKFTECHFGQIRIYESSKFINVQFDDTNVDSVKQVEQNSEFWEPVSVRALLQQIGVLYPLSDKVEHLDLDFDGKMDLDLRDLEKLLRYFIRSTHISESVILIKLGTRARYFLDSTVPLLLERGVLCEIDNKGGVPQRRFKMGSTLESVNEAISAAHGSFSEFLKIV